MTKIFTRWTPFLILCLGSTVASADRFTELLDEAQAAQGRNDVVAARAALEAAQRELRVADTATISAHKSSASASAAAPTTTTQATTAATDEDTNILQRLSEKGFRLQLGPGLQGDDAGPASFGFSRDYEADTDTRIDANFTLGYNSARRTRQVKDALTGEVVNTLPEGAQPFFGNENAVWTWDASIQGQLSSIEDKANSWTFRLGGEIDHSTPTLSENTKHLFRIQKKIRQENPNLPDPAVVAETRRIATEEGVRRPFYIGSWWSIKAKHEADQNFDNQRLSAEVTMTPTFSIPGNGIFWPHKQSSPNAPMRFVWRPYFGVDAGGQIASDGTIDAVDDTFRLIGELKAGISFDFVQRSLGLKSVTLYVKDKFNYLTESSNGYNHLTTTLNFGFTDNLGFAFNYVNGEKPPTFERAETFSAAFTANF